MQNSWTPVCKERVMVVLRMQLNIAIFGYKMDFLMNLHVFSKQTLTPVVDIANVSTLKSLRQNSLVLAFRCVIKG